jgi:hypothetical protein
VSLNTINESEIERSVDKLFQAIESEDVAAGKTAAKHLVTVALVLLLRISSALASRHQS